MTHQFRPDELKRLPALALAAGFESVEAFWRVHNRQPIAKLSIGSDAVSRGNRPGASSEDVDAAIVAVSGYSIELAVHEAAKAISGGKVA